MKGAAPAFSVLELVVIIGILTILATVLVPVTRTGIARGKSAQCLGNLKSLGSAFGRYFAENNMRFPIMEAGRTTKEENLSVLDTILAPYVDDARIFACPGDTDGLGARSGTSYYYNSALSGQSLAGLNFLGLTKEATRIPVLVDKEGWHRGTGQPVNHLFADGHASAELRLFAE